MPISTMQMDLFDTCRLEKSERASGTFTDNMKLPVHRWFRYSAGFSAHWAQALISEVAASNREAIRVHDPFCGSGTTILAAQAAGVESYGVESHPFVARVARAKLARCSDPAAYRKFANAVLESAKPRKGSCDGYPPLIRKCYQEPSLLDLDRIRCAYEDQKTDSPQSELTWLTLVGILRKTSHVGTANWQYVLPRKRKAVVAKPFDAFEEQIATIYRDMVASQHTPKVPAVLALGDARDCGTVPSRSVDLVLTSPPYPNNYDYADATRLEMSFMREIRGWGDLHNAVRKHLIVSCSQHVPEKAVYLRDILSAPEVSPIRQELSQVCRELERVRLSKGGKKTYHLMVACYFRDLSRVWVALRRVCKSPCKACFVLGDSAPYGVYVPVAEWMGRLATAAGFSDYKYEKLRDRNIKWKNRKHRVPLSEGRLWVDG